MTNNLTSFALRAFLNHKLAEVLRVASGLNESLHCNDNTVLQQSVTACEQLIKYVRSAQLICGSFGLAAIDRAESHLLACVNALKFPHIPNLSHQSAFTVAGICFANALNRKCHGDSKLTEMWLFAAKCSDTAGKLSSEVTSVDNNNSYTEPNKRNALINEAKQFDEKNCVSMLAGKLLTSKLWAKAAHICRYAVVCARIGELHQKFRHALSATAYSVDTVMQAQFKAATAAIATMEQAVRLGSWVEVEQNPRVRTLFLLAIQRLEYATSVELKSLPSSVIADTDYPEGYFLQAVGPANANQPTASWKANAVALAKLAVALSPVMAQIANIKAKAQGSISRAELPVVIQSVIESIGTVILEIGLRPP